MAVVNNRFKFIIIIILIVSLGFLINSRRVKQDVFDLIVLTNLCDVLEKCNKRLDLHVSDSVRFNYNDSLYNYYIDNSNIDICNKDNDSLKMIIGKQVKVHLAENWKFVY